MNGPPEGLYSVNVCPRSGHAEIFSIGDAELDELKSEVWDLILEERQKTAAALFDTDLQQTLDRAEDPDAIV